LLDLGDDQSSLNACSHDPHASFQSLIEAFEPLYYLYAPGKTSGFIHPIATRSMGKEKADQDISMLQGVLLWPSCGRHLGLPVGVLDL
jgi:hypothetical protein